MSISHGTVAALSFLLLLVVTIFNFAGGAGVTVDANAGVNKEIRGFHGGNDTENMSVPQQAQTMRNQTEHSIFNVPLSLNDNLFTQTAETEIFGNSWKPVAELLAFTGYWSKVRQRRLTFGNSLHGELSDQRRV